MFRLAAIRVTQLVARPVVIAPRLTPFYASFSNGRKRAAKSVSHETNRKNDKKSGKEEDFKKPDKQALSELLKEIDITSDEMSANEVQKLKELDHMLSESPELRNMSMEEIIGMLNITEEDKKELNSQLDRIINNEKPQMTDAELRKEFPGLEKDSMEVVKALDAECSKNPEFRAKFLAWTQQVQEALGNDMERMKTMSEDELTRITTPPPDVREVLDRITPNMGELGNVMRMDDDDTWKDGPDGEPVEVEEIKLK